MRYVIATVKHGVRFGVVYEGRHAEKAVKNMMREWVYKAGGWGMGVVAMVAATPPEHVTVTEMAA